MNEEIKNKGRPRKYTDLEQDLLSRCHDVEVQHILKICIFKQSEECLRMLLRIYKVRKISAKTFRERQICKTVIKYIYIYIEQMDFKALYRENQMKYGVELDKAEANEERDDTDIDVTGEGGCNEDYENPTNDDEKYDDSGKGYDHSTGEENN